MLMAVKKGKKTKAEQQENDRSNSDGSADEDSNAKRTFSRNHNGNDFNLREKTHTKHKERVCQTFDGVIPETTCCMTKPYAIAICCTNV